MNKILKYYRVIRSKSIRYILFRSKYEIERRTGLLVGKFPTKMDAVPLPSLAEWQEKEDGYFFNSKESLQIDKEKSSMLKKAMEHILQGDVLFFSKTWKSLGLDYDWVTNPETGYTYNTDLHWTKVNDFSQKSGDIKFVWEKSRFSWLLTVCRYDYHFNEDHADFVFNQIMDWIDKNPLNCGPNYKCSQEISIRINNWLFALNFYKHSKALTEERWITILTSIYWQTDHVMKNINYSRIAVRNNHAITETLTLYLMGLLFPMMKGAAKWKKNGKRWFEEEIDYQVEDDGTFIQDSMNYHRVVIQLLSYAISLSDKHGEKFTDIVYEKAYKSLFFLYQCQEPSNGWLPNYGSNDGALFFPLSDADYRDYRPQLDALHGLLTGQSLYGNYLEDAQWLDAKVPKGRRIYSPIKRQFGLVTFEKSGYYLIREEDTLTFMRCGLFKTKGSTDQLHLDVWYKGENVLLDCGSYMYNTDENTVSYFAGTESHNTIMLDDYDQMLKGPRFMWFYPTQLIHAKTNDTKDSFEIEGMVKCFRHVNDNIMVKRTVTKKKGIPIWFVQDYMENKPNQSALRQLWHTVDSQQPVIISSDGQKTKTTRWYSSYYGVKESCSQTEFKTLTNKIATTIKIEA